MFEIPWVCASVFSLLNTIFLSIFRSCKSLIAQTYEIPLFSFQTSSWLYQVYRGVVSKQEYILIDLHDFQTNGVYWLLIWSLCLYYKYMHEQTFKYNRCSAKQPKSHVGGNVSYPSLH